MKINIEVNSVEVALGKNPGATIYGIIVSADNVELRETFSSEEAKDAFIKGVKAVALMHGNLEVDVATILKCWRSVSTMNEEANNA